MSGFVMNNIARAVVGADKTYAHMFGGVPRHAGVIPKGCQQPLHLLYTLDTSDPLCPISIPSIRYLPLYYGFPYNAGALGYKVISENEIQILHMESKSIVEDFPYPNYPDAFPETPISLLPISYEEHKTLVYIMACDDYHVEDIYIQQADHDFIQRSQYPFTQFGGIQRLWQGAPEEPCPNGKCENHEISNFMEIFAVIWNQPVPGVYLWDNDPEFRDMVEVQTIFQICPLCHAIYVCNRSS